MFLFLNYQDFDKRKKRDFDDEEEPTKKEQIVKPKIRPIVSIFEKAVPREDITGLKVSNLSIQ